MSKLPDFYEHLNLAECAKYLSQKLDEPIAIPDVLNLAINGHLKLSVELITPVPAYEGRIVSKKEVTPARYVDYKYNSVDHEEIYQVTGKTEKEIQELLDNGDLTAIYPAIVLNDNELITISQGIPQNLTGTFDLLMFGKEKLFIENLRRKLIEEPDVELLSLFGCFLQEVNDESKVFQLLEDGIFDPETGEEIKQQPGIVMMNPVHSPLMDFPSESTIVVRIESLKEFASKAKTKATPKRENNKKEQLIRQLIEICHKLELENHKLKKFSSDAKLEELDFNKHSQIYDYLLNISGIQANSLAVSKRTFKKILNDGE